jgi:hypothetical protein
MRGITHKKSVILPREGIENNTTGRRRRLGVVRWSGWEGRLPGRRGSQGVPVVRGGLLGPPGPSIPSRREVPWVLGNPAGWRDFQRFAVFLQQQVTVCVSCVHHRAECARGKGMRRAFLCTQFAIMGIQSFRKSSPWPRATYIIPRRPGSTGRTHVAANSLRADFPCDPLDPLEPLFSRETTNTTSSQKKMRISRPRFPRGVESTAKS